MTSQNPHQPQLFQGLEELLAEYLQNMEDGAIVDADALAARYPEHRNELLEFIAMDRQFRDRTQSLGGEIPLAESQNTVAVDASISNGANLNVGDYELLEEIDRGGMGIVFRARHKTLKRTAAIKMLLAGTFASSESALRFRREAAAAARLNHPGIVAVYDVGVVDQPGPLHGQTWYAMAFVEGSDLAQRIETNLFDSRSAATLMLRIADAVQFAHGRGVIHRDLKPANILLDNEGVPHVTDFGLSRCQEENETQLTADGQIFGTPGYMPPEQATGENDSVGIASDIYSLGAVLYCMLTGRPPFRANSTMATLQQVIHDAPAPPRLLNRDVHPDLESIILKCLEKQIRDRYQSVEALREDLQRFVHGEPVSAASLNLVGYLGRVLASSRNSEFVQGWSRALYLVAAVVMVSHLMLQFAPLTATQATVLNAGKYLLLLAVIWKARNGILTPQNSVERAIWSLWIGYILSYLAAEVMVRMPGGDGTNLHAVMSLVSSVILLVLGGHLWGGCYLIGGVFLALAPLLTAAPKYGVLCFGGLWALTFSLLGRRYSQQSSGRG